MQYGWLLVTAFGSTPTVPARREPLPSPPSPLPPAAPPAEGEATQAIGEDAKRQRRRFTLRQSILTGAPVGLTGDRPLGT